MAKNFREAVIHILARIPCGTVATYGQLALLAGRPRASRIVGAIMAGMPDGSNLPCHRVIYSDGSLCKGEIFGGISVQRELLASEGVVFLPDGRADLSISLWHPDEAFPTEPIG